MAESDQSTHKNGESIIITTKTPYSSITHISSYTDNASDRDIYGHISDKTHYNREFRWSYDGILYNNYTKLTSEKLSNLPINKDKSYYFQYKYTQIGSGELSVSEIQLNTLNVNGTITTIPMCKIQNGSCCGNQNLVFECCGAGSGFNPYDIGHTAAIYAQMSQIVSNTFGVCVQYFKTAMDQRSKDVILHEYSLGSVISEGNIQILFPDNSLPSREIRYDTMMMDFQNSFEVHIVKSSFQAVFGESARPEVHDYLYESSYTNKIYEVNSVSETDDYMYIGTYWRVQLVQYQQRTNISFETEELDVDTHTLLFDMDKFNEEVDKQTEDARKPEQYNTIGPMHEGNDYVRRILDKKLVIESIPIYNNWTMISKSYYDLQSIDYGNLALEYKYNKGWDSTEERMFTFWIRPMYQKSQHRPKLITNLQKKDNKLRVNLYDVTGLKTGMYVKPAQLQSYKGMYKIIEVNEVDKYIVLDTEYINDCHTPHSKITAFASNTFFRNKDENGNTGIEITQTSKSIIIVLNGNTYSFDITNNGNFEMNSNEWYGLIIAIKPGDSRIALWVYSLGDGKMSNGMDSKIKLEYYSMIEASDIENSGGYYDLIACDMHLSNLRIWNEICEDNLHDLILSQFVVKDSHLCELVDNAQPELLMNKVTNPR